MLPHVFTESENSRSFVTKEVVFKDDVTTGRKEGYAIQVVRDGVISNVVVAGTRESYPKIVIQSDVVASDRVVPRIPEIYA